jgi:hypothetical protein
LSYFKILHSLKTLPNPITKSLIYFKPYVLQRNKQPEYQLSYQISSDYTAEDRNFSDDLQITQDRKSMTAAV